MFSNVVVSALAFIVALGILVSIHEYGHFWVARRVGIKVLRYSVGFGHALYTRVGKVDGTEYVVGAIPLGGYVKMLDEREGPVAESERHRSFNQKSLWARSAVVLAGPMANFLLAIVAYWVVMMIGISGVAPLVGAPVAGSAAAAAGFQYEDRIVSVDGRKTPTWTDARIALLESSMNTTAPLQIEVEDASGSQVFRQLSVTQDQMLKAEGDAVANLGFRAWWPEVDPIVGDVVDGGAANAAGLQPGDVVVSIDGKAIDNWMMLVEAVQPSAGVALNVQIQRGDTKISVALTPEPFVVGGNTIGRIGVIETQSAARAEKAKVIVKHAPVQALGEAVKRTWDMTALTVRMLGKLLFGQASLDNISGPISIAKYAGQSASIGIDHYINFIALISISLAVLNLLPVPMLDGGHLLFFAAEAIRGKPLPESVQIIGQQIGMALLGALMFLAFYNDIWRLFR
ncbi:MAG: regulator of sigma E protease [Granulosicoccus sp.]|jgi:regulator of sigma E protease